MSAVIAAGATLLLGGVMTLAPLLSLALHQSYDSVFEVTKQLIQTPASAEDKSLATEHIHRLQADLEVYRRFDPWWYAMWIFSVVVMAAIPVIFLFSPWFDKAPYRLSIIFLLWSSILCVLFAFLSIAFFVKVRPGVTKLELFLKTLESMATKEQLSIRQKQRISNPSAMWPTAAAVFAIAIISLASIAWWPKDDELTVAVNSVAVASGPVFLVTDVGFAENLGLKLVEKPFAAGRLALDALLGGQVDVATAAETPILYASLYASVKRPDLRIILTIAESEFRIVARPQAGIANFGDLKGKKVATLLGTSAEYFLDRMLAEHGLNRNEIDIHNLQPADMVAALRSGTVDAITVWEPHAWKATTLIDDALVFEGRKLYLERFNLVTTDSVLADPSKRAAIKKLVTAIIAASTYMQHKEDDTIILLAKRIGMHVHELNIIWDRFSFPAHLDPALLSSLQNVEAWAAQKDGRKVRRTGVLDIVAPGILREINPDRVLIRY